MKIDVSKLELEKIKSFEHLFKGHFEVQNEKVFWIKGEYNEEMIGVR